MFGELEKVASKNVEYVLNEDNTLMKLRIEFSKNPVGTYDETILKLTIIPNATFPTIIEKMQLYFSEDLLNTEITIGSEFKAGTAYNYEIPIYITPASPSSIRFNNVVICAALPEYLSI